MGFEEVIFDEVINPPYQMQKRIRKIGKGSQRIAW
jgi:hypothetical protein